MIEIDNANRPSQKHLVSCQVRSQYAMSRARIDITPTILLATRANPSVSR